MEFVGLEKRGHIALLKLNRPKALNALNTAMLNEIEMAAARVERDPEVRVLIISGEGKAFGAGADIGEMVGLSRAEAKAFADAGHRAFKQKWRHWSRSSKNIPIDSRQLFVLLGSIVRCSIKFSKFSASSLTTILTS